MTAFVAVGGVIAAPIAAQAAEEPSIMVGVTEVANERVVFAIEGTGFGDIQALPGQTEPHAYFKLNEVGSDLSEVAQDDTSISASIAEGGTLSDELSVPIGELDASKSYEVISWPSRSFPTEENVYARTAVTIDWDALFPSDEAAVPSFTAEATEFADERVDFAIEGSGFGDVTALPGQTEPHAYFTLIEVDADLSEVGQADTAISASIAEDGTLSDVLEVPADDLDATKSYEVISWPSRS
ncbi:MAG: hypothetical protein ACTH3U_07525, partial [Microbacterium gubbeenense]